MQEPSKKRRKAVLVALSPMRTRVLLRKHESSWNLPDSHLHWPIGKRTTAPSKTVIYMLREATLSLAGDTHTLKELLTSKGTRKKLATGGFVFVLPSTDKFNISTIVQTSSSVRKFLGITSEKVEMHSIDDILKVENQCKYGGSTIEAVRSIFQLSGALDDIPPE